jgi:hypothetical protein
MAPLPLLPPRQQRQRQRQPHRATGSCEHDLSHSDATARDVPRIRLTREAMAPLPLLPPAGWAAELALSVSGGWWWTCAAWRPNRIRGTSLAATPPPPTTTTTPRRTSWLGRTHSRDEAVRHGAAAAGAGAGLSRSTTRVSDVSAHGGDRTRTTASEQAVPPTETRTTERTKPPTTRGEPSANDPLTYGLPYPPLREPLPAPSHALYPNWTPPDPDAAQGYFCFSRATRRPGRVSLGPP